jgi:hypothetical protein
MKNIKNDEFPKINEQDFNLSFDLLEDVIKKWAVMSQFEKDLENYDTLKHGHEWQVLDDND